MKEENIRPNNLIEKVIKLKQKDVRYLLKQKQDFISISCPACDSDSYFKKFEKNGFNFTKCNSCDTLFINPRPSIDMLSNYYNTSESWKFWNDYIFPSSEETRREKIFIPRAKRVIDLCRAHNIKNETLLDVGAGFGTFCEEIIKLDYFKKVIAVEPTPDLAESCRRKGISVIELPIEKVSMETVDLITNFELIEHLFYPKDFLISCNRALSNNGLLILTTPNIKGFDLLLLEELSDNVDGPNHLNYFHPDSLKILLKNTGFNIIEILTPGKLDVELVRKKVLSGVFDISNNKFLKQILIDGWGSLSKKFQEFLALNNLSSHLWVVAKKIA